jgi:hypothetical protein
MEVIIDDFKNGEDMTEDVRIECLNKRDRTDAHERIKSMAVQTPMEPLGNSAKLTQYRDQRWKVALLDLRRRNKRMGRVRAGD